MKTGSYGFFVAKIYDYVLIDSFRGSAGFLASPTSFVTLVNMKFANKKLPVATNITTALSVTSFKFVNHFSRMGERVKVNARKLVLPGLVEMYSKKKYELQIPSSAYYILQWRVQSYHLARLFLWSGRISGIGNQDLNE